MKPAAPPPLVRLLARQIELEAERSRLFAIWRAALEKNDGNEVHAAESLGWDRDRGHSMTRRFGLGAWARELRIAAGVPATGRPPSNNE